MQASSLLLSHAAHRRHVQAHYHAGRCLSAAALCMEPGQWSVRERPRSEPHCRTHVSAVTPPLCGPQTYTHTHRVTQRTSLSSLTNLYMDSLTHSLSDKSQCDPFHVLIPLFVNWFRLCDTTGASINLTDLSLLFFCCCFFIKKLQRMQLSVVQCNKAICVNYVEHSRASKSRYTTGTNKPPKVEKSS